MFFKKFKKSFACLLLTSLFIIPNKVLAYSDYIIPGGENVGIEVNSTGVIVVGIYEINGNNPALDAGIKTGDIITSINGNKVSSIEALVKEINKSNSLTITVDYLRDDKSYNTKLTIFKEDNIYKTGLYVKDSITGIGTLSFIDPNTRKFGALGHEIIESNTGKILEIKDGKIFESNVTNIERSENGNPGSKTADLKLNNEQGIISENTSSGIFGDYTATLPDKKQYKVAQVKDIKKGKATILTVVDGNQIEEFEINILKINKDSNQKTKNILFEITDSRLLEKTGGIIQGMSGSPIIQGDFIIGAVTHVVVDNPKNGYGIFITNMLEEAEN